MHRSDVPLNVMCMHEIWWAGAPFPDFAIYLQSEAIDRCYKLMTPHRELTQAASNLVDL